MSRLPECPALSIKEYSSSYIYAHTHTKSIEIGSIPYIEAKAINIFSLLLPFPIFFGFSNCLQHARVPPPPTVYTSWRIPSIFRSIVYPIPVVPFISNRSAILNEIRLSVFPFILLAYVIIAFDWTAEHLSKNLYKIIIGCVYSLQQALLIKRIDFIIFLELFLCLPADASTKFSARHRTKYIEESINLSIVCWMYILLDALSFFEFTARLDMPWPATLLRVNRTINFLGCSPPCKLYPTAELLI